MFTVLNHIFVEQHWRMQAFKRNDDCLRQPRQILAENEPWSENGMIPVVLFKQVLQFL